MTPVGPIIPIVPAGAEGAADGAVRAASRTRAGGGTLLSALPPLTLYVHYPWCLRKCPYCDFNSHEHGKGPEVIPEDAYLAALRADLEQAVPLVWGRKVHAVFIGGGTPSLLSAAGLDRLLSDVRMLLPVEADAEITLEANPGTFEAGKFAAYRASGVNRLSIGIQSFDDARLAALGRVHDGREARRAIEIAQASFDNFNLDLMYALPGQDLAAAQADLATALAFAPPHLSLYHLSIEPNTVFAKYPPVVPDEDDAALIQDAVAEAAAAAGYDRYEVSAWARPGRRCRHNLNYWRFGDYLGIGAGAHGKLSFPDRIVRQMRHRSPASYLAEAAAGRFVAEEHVVGPADLPFEFMLNALRLVEGVPAASFAERTGLSLSAIERPRRLAEERGLLEHDHAVLRATVLGQRFLNDLQALFLPEGD